MHYIFRLWYLTVIFWIYNEIKQGELIDDTITVDNKNKRINNLKWLIGKNKNIEN